MQKGRAVPAAVLQPPTPANAQHTSPYSRRGSLSPLSLLPSLYSGPLPSPTPTQRLLPLREPHTCFPLHVPNLRPILLDTVSRVETRDACRNMEGSECLASNHVHSSFWRPVCGCMRLGERGREGGREGGSGACAFMRPCMHIPDSQQMYVCVCARECACQ